MKTSTIIMRPQPLSPRELEVARLIAHGSTGKEISSDLRLSENTVETHRKNIFKKLQVKNIAAMIMAMFRLGILNYDRSGVA